MKVAEITEMIQTSLDNDAAARVTGSVALATSTYEAAAAADSVNMSLTQTVNMQAAKETAATVLSDAVSEEDSSSSSSVVHLDSVPAASVVDSGIQFVFLILII